jgi:hypothetical protein
MLRHLFVTARIRLNANLALKQTGFAAVHSAECHYEA